MVTDVKGVHSGLHGWFLTACRWISRLALLNLIWLALCVVGLVAGGFFPATATLFALVRRWLLAQGDDDRPLLNAAWHYFRVDFWAANALGYGLTVFGYLLYLDVRLFAGSGGPLALILLVASLAVCLLYALTLLYIGPVFVHLEARWYQQIRVAAVFGLSHPFSALHAALVGGGLYVVFLQVPGLVVFFGGSVVATLATWQLTTALRA
jgi:uncharacterized membrane protein YesL